MLSSPPPPPERLELALLGWAKTWATPQPLPRACLNRPVVRMPDSICANSALGGLRAARRRRLTPAQNDWRFDW